MKEAYFTPAADFNIEKVKIDITSHAIKGGFKAGQINVMAAGVKTGHSRILPGPVPVSADEPIPDTGLWHQCLIYNIEEGKFLCWNRIAHGRDNRVANLIWCDADESNDRILVLPDADNIQDFELKRANKENDLSNIGSEVYDYLEEIDIWDGVVFAPLIHSSHILIADGRSNTLIEKVDFVQGFMI